MEEQITCDPQVCSGKPCIKGTRIPVHIIVDLLAAGETFEGIKIAYPNISDVDIIACLKYAAHLVEEEATELSEKSKNHREGTKGRKYEKFNAFIYNHSDNFASSLLRAFAINLWFLDTLLNRVRIRSG